MRIAIVTQSFYPRMGGLSEYVAGSARELMRRGHEVTVLTGRPASRGDAVSDFRCIRLGRNVPVPALGAISDVAVGRGLHKALERLLVPRHFDVAHVHSPLAPTLPLFATQASQVPVVGQFHSSARSHAVLGMARGLLKPAYDRMSARLAVSEASRQFFGRYFDVSDVRVVPGGIDPHRFGPGAPPYARLRDDKLNLLFVGRLEPRKGVHVLQEALRRLRLGDRARLLVVGDGPLRHPLMAQGRFAGCETLYMRSVTPDLLARVYASADILCAPATRNESFGMVLLEGLAMGLPVIASDLAGYRSVVREDQDGLLARPGDAADWARAVGHLVTDEPARRKFASGARARALEFAWPRIVDLLEAEYRKVAGAEPERAGRKLKPLPAPAAGI